MDAGVIFAIVASLVVLAAVVWFGLHIRRRDHPEDTATHGSTEPEPAGKGPTDPYPRGARPAGPGAEAMGVTEDGRPIAGEPFAGGPGSPAQDPSEQPADRR